MKRIDGRNVDQFRQIRVTKNYLSHPLSSVLIEVGGTKVICSVSVENRVPGWMRAQKVSGGWVTCEYGMIPPSTHDRVRREASQGKQGGRTMEIQRLIGRSFRSVIDLEALGERTVYIDCDVIDADGGTRCASITGASIALQLAFNSARGKRLFGKNPMRENVAAISVGVVDGTSVLDLCYDEDSNADVDFNVVMTESGKFVEVQGTAEKDPFSMEQLQEMLGLARDGLEKIFTIQNKVITTRGNGGRNGNANGRGQRRPADNFGSLGEIMGDLKV